MLAADIAEPREVAVPGGSSPRRVRCEICACEVRSEQRTEISAGVNLLRIFSTAELLETKLMRPQRDGNRESDSKSALDATLCVAAEFFPHI